MTSKLFPIILHMDNIDVSKIKFKKKYYSSNSFSKVPIRYKRQPLIIQTPKLYVPYDVRFYGYSKKKNIKCSICLSLSNHEIDKTVCNFYHKLKEIEEVIKKRFKYKKIKKNKKNKNKHTVRQYREFKPIIRDTNLVKISIPFYKENPMIKVYDQSKTEVDFDNIGPRIYSHSLICIESVWFFNEAYGVTINLLQIRLEIPLLLEEYSFEDNCDKPQNKLRNDPKYKKYFKMLDLKIPIFVVKQKMILAGHNPELLDDNYKPPIQDIQSQETDVNTGTLFLTSMSTLKRVKSKPKQRKRLSIQGYNVPTLDAIVNCLSTLKKVRRTSEV